MSDLIVVYRLDSGAAVSVGSVAPAVIPADMAVKAIVSPTWEQFAAGGWLWDPATLTVATIPVPLEIVVSKNLQTKARTALAKNTAALASQATMLTNLNALTTVAVTNVAGAQTAIRNLAVEVRKLATNADERVRQDSAIIRLLLGDFYADVSVLQTEDGT